MLDLPSPGRLTSGQIDALIAVVRAPQTFAEPVSAVRAIQVLAAGTKEEVWVPVLVEVARDRREPRAVRITALRELVRSADPRATKALVSHARGPDPRLQQAALAGLGTFAGPAILRNLATCEPNDAAGARQLALTRALIAHRHGLNGPFLP